MIEIDIPGFGPVMIEHLVFDFNGTLAEDGKLCEGVRDRLIALSKDVQIHILTADTFNMARDELKGINCRITITQGENHDILKEEYVKSLGPENVVSLGNGNNDRRMLRITRIGIAVCLKEGCAIDAIKNADILVTSSIDALDFLSNKDRLKATLRF